MPRTKTKTKKRNLAGGSEYNKVITLRSKCTKYTKKSGSGDYSQKCECSDGATIGSYQFNSRFFDCNEGDGLVLKPIISDNLGEVFANFHSKIKDLESASSRNNVNIDTLISDLLDEYNNLPLSIDVQQFIRGYIKDQYKNKKKDVSLKNIEDLIGVLDTLKGSLTDKLKESNRKFTMEDFKVVLENLKKTINVRLTSVQNLQLTKEELDKPEYYRNAKEIAESKDKLNNQKEIVVRTMELIKKEIELLLSNVIYKQLYKKDTIQDTMKYIIQLDLDQGIDKSEHSYQNLMKTGFYKDLKSYTEGALLRYYYNQKTSEDHQKIIDFVTNWIHTYANEDEKILYENYVAFTTNRTRLIKDLASNSDNKYNYSVESFYNKCIKTENCEGVGSKINRQFIIDNIRETLREYDDIKSSYLEEFKKRLQYLELNELEETYIKLQTDRQGTISNILNKSIDNRRFKSRNIRANNIWKQRHLRNNSRGWNNRRRTSWNSGRNSRKDPLKELVAEELKDSRKYEIIYVRNRNYTETLKVLYKKIDTGAKEVSHFVRNTIEGNIETFITNTLLFHHANRYIRSRGKNNTVQRDKNTIIKKFVTKWFEDGRHVEDEVIKKRFKIFLKTHKNVNFIEDLITFLNENEGNIGEYLEGFTNYKIQDYLDKNEAEILDKIEKIFEDKLKLKTAEALVTYIFSIAFDDNFKIKSTDDLQDELVKIEGMNSHALKAKLKLEV